MPALPDKLAWLAKEPGPRMLVEALKLYGTKETLGDADNPVILDWAKETGLRDIYRKDATPWCGLFLAFVAKRAGKAVPPAPLWALGWANFGKPVDDAMLGDVLVFKRPGGGGHVGIYCAESDAAYFVLGGNQGDAVSVAPIAKDRLKAIRRPLYQTQPANVRAIHMDAGGRLSTNEA